ncbi:acyltransferase [Spirosoma agri]|uniref:Acyltransferase n=1 Tax=Spirosoma agri TaxID=1987381 RepID=A0A6M0IPM7_9BACT|nr:acyltransferase [Spirosoma agri]NEU69331.1 acyltransferase [Spirosoma agri]
MRSAISLVLNSIRNWQLALQTALFYQKMRLFYPNVTLGKNIRLYGKLIWKVAPGAKIVIGDNVVFRSSTQYNAIGLYNPVIISVANGATLHIDHDCGFSGTSINVTSSVTIGPYCNLGGNTSIWDNDFHPLDYQLRRTQLEGFRKAAIAIGADSFIGANSIILKGVTIGERSIVGAGSVVTRTIPDDQIWAGNPARFIRDVPASTLAEITRPAYSL